MTKSEILKYIMNTPENTNPMILIQMLESFKDTPVITDESSFTNAVTDTSVGSIEFSAPLNMSSETQITHKITIDGNNQPITTSAQGKVLTFMAGANCNNIIIESTADNTDWHSSYGIQFYTDENTLSNSKFSGCNAAILVNGGKLTLNGTIDVSNNTFGGIEVSKGSAEGLDISILDVTNANIINTSEEYGKPTIWIDGITDEAGKVIGVSNMTKIIFTKEDGTQQIHYYLNSKNTIKPE